MEEHSRFEADSVFVALLTRKKDISSSDYVDLNDALSRYKTFGSADRSGFFQRSTRGGTSRSFAT